MPKHAVKAAEHVILSLRRISSNTFNTVIVDPSQAQDDGFCHFVYILSGCASHYAPGDKRVPGRTTKANSFMNKQLELISPEMSQFLVLVASIVIAVVGGALGFIYRKTRGLVALLCGPLVWILWMIHGALVARFGMDSLGLLLFEGVVFVAIGAALGILWGRIGARNAEN